MKITILTQYYPPETGAPQNRLHSLARHIASAGHDVQVITALPNYPKRRVFDGYRGKLFVTETIDGIRVLRSWIYVPRRDGMAARLASYLSFVLTSFAAGLRSGPADLLICESPPLFLGITGVLLARLRRARLVFNVSDLWPETAVKLGLVRPGLALRLAYALEAWLYRQAQLVTGQTQGIVADVARRFPGKRVFWLPNGVDAEVYEAAGRGGPWRERLGVDGRKLFVYAGLLGHAQGLEVVVRAAAGLRDRADIAFVIVGDGPLAAQLQTLNQELDAGVVFVPGVPRSELVSLVAAAFACIVPLRPLELFRGAIPSKLFDPLALGVPILLGVDGEARELFVERAGAGLFFEPGDAEALGQAVVALAADPGRRTAMGEAGRTFVRQHFDRRRIAAAFLQELGAP